MNTDPQVAAACARLAASRSTLRAARIQSAEPSAWQALVGRHPWLLSSGGLLLGGLVMAWKPWRALPTLARALPAVMAALTAAGTVLPWASWLTNWLDALRGSGNQSGSRTDVADPAPAPPPA